jgi:hypothetical protein
MLVTLRMQQPRRVGLHAQSIRAPIRTVAVDIGFVHGLEGLDRQ